MKGDSAAFGLALRGGPDDLHGPKRVVEAAQVADEARDGAVEVEEHLLADRPVAFERLLMAAGRVEPDEAGGQVDEGDPVLADHLKGRGGPEADRFLPLLRQRRQRNQDLPK